MQKPQPFLRIAAATAVVLTLPACSWGGAPSYVIFGAYFPRWLMAGLIGILAAVIAHRVFVATGWNRKVPLQLSVCSAIGLAVAVLFWALGTR